MILYFKSMKALELLRCFKNLSYIDKLRLVIHLLENSDLNINTDNELNMLKNQLTEEEYKSLRCQFVTLNKSGRGQHRKYMPYAYTEQGISMLSPLLNSDIAVSVSINFMQVCLKFFSSKNRYFSRCFCKASQSPRHLFKT